MQRRQLMALGLMSLAGTAMPAAWAATARPTRLAAAWRIAPPIPGGSGQDYAGVLQLDWDGGAVRIEAQTLLQERVHGLALMGDGGFIAVGARPGRTLLRFDASGALVQTHALASDAKPNTLGGHALLSADGQTLYTAETQTATDTGWLVVRDAQTLRKLDQWPTHGRDPHQMLLDGHGAILVANGGIPRQPDGSKHHLHDMRSSLVRLDARTGALLGQWQLPDARLSLRHMAWGGSSEQPLVGLGIQAEHDSSEARSQAPSLAVWDGHTLTVPSQSALGAGYTGDIAPGPQGGFVLSAQKSGRGLLWQPDAPAKLLTIAELREVCAVAAPKDHDQPLILGAARGVARWHPTQAAAMLPWPQAMSPDNHWEILV